MCLFHGYGCWMVLALVLMMDGACSMVSEMICISFLDGLLGRLL